MTGIIACRTGIIFLHILGRDESEALCPLRMTRASRSPRFRLFLPKYANKLRLFSRLIV